MKNLVYGIVLAAVLALGLAGFVTCENPAGDGVARVQDRHLYKTTWVAAADGANGAVTSTKIDFTFSRAVAGLTADDIEVESGAQLADGETIKGALTGGGTAWSLALTDQSIAENVRVRVFNDDVESKTRDVAVYREGAPTTLVWTARADGAAGSVTSTKIDFAFSGAVAGLTAENITVTDGTGTVTTGALTGGGAAWALGLTVAAAGNVDVRIAKESVDDGAKYIDVYKQGGSLGTGHHEGWVDADSITVTKDGAAAATLTLKTDETAQLAVAFTPSTVSDPTVKWTSDKPGVVSVSEAGLVTALGQGAAQVRATAAGASAVCAVTVTGNTPGLFEGDEPVPKVGVSDLNTGENLLAKSLAWIKANGTAGTSEQKSQYTIVLNADISVSTGFSIGTGTTSSSTGNGNNNKNLSITVRGLKNESDTSDEFVNNVVVEKTGTGALFTVYGTDATDEPELTLENITLKGTIGNNTALVVVGNAAAKKGALTMKAGSRITGNTSTGTAANGGGGVLVKASSTFTMEDGLIDGNTGVVGGGVTGNTNCTFTMTDGEIKDNLAVGSSTNTAGQGGGVNMLGTSTFIMSGGVIQYNTAQNRGTGYGLGGGVYVAAGNFTMSGDAKILKNTAERGGGIYLAGTVNMQGGSIEGNTAAHGAAVVLFGTNGSFTKTGGTVYGTPEGDVNAGERANKGTEGSSSVHAIEYLTGSSSSPTVSCYYDGTAGPTVELKMSENEKEGMTTT
jgi:uncharacterized protein YjdB